VFAFFSSVSVTVMLVIILILLQLIAAGGSFTYSGCGLTKEEIRGRLIELPGANCLAFRLSDRVYITRKSCAFDLSCLGCSPVKIINYDSSNPNHDAALIITEQSCESKIKPVCIGNNES